MATAATPQHVETQARAQPVAETPSQVEVRKVAIDNSTLSVLAVGVGLFALAFGAFTHLRERTDSLDAKIDKVATELRTEIKDVNAKVDKLGADLNAKIDKLGTEMNAKIDRVDTKIDAVNARLDRLFELIASQGRGEPR